MEFESKLTIRLWKKLSFFLARKFYPHIIKNFWSLNYVMVDYMQNYKTPKFVFTFSLNYFNDFVYVIIWCDYIVLKKSLILLVIDR